MAEENAVALKLPTFWTSQPRVWFAQAEAQFVIRKITTDDTKYYHVLSALDQDTATRLLDLISSPPSENKYQALKDRLVETFGLSKRDARLNLPRATKTRSAITIAGLGSLLDNAVILALGRETGRPVANSGFGGRP